MLGLSALSVTALAQQQAVTANDYRVSVFANSERLQPLKRADIGVHEKLATQFPGWYIETDKWTGGFKELNGKPMNVSGSSLEIKARNCMDNQLSAAGMKSSDWVLTGQNTDKKGNVYLYFTQKLEGHKVTFAKLNFKFTAAQALSRVSMRGYGAADSKLVPSISTDDVLAAATKDMGSVTITSRSVDDAWEWFPVPSAQGYTLRPAYKFHVNAVDANDAKATPLELSGYVDAISGDMLYRDNGSHDIADLKVKGTVYKDGKLLPATDQPLKDLEVTINADPTALYTDTSGYVSGPSGSLPDTFTVSLQGRYCTVFAAASGSVTPSFQTVVSALGTDYVFPVAAPSSSRHVNAYYHVNRVHDFMKDHLTPSFTDMDSPLPTNVDVSGACNAFYSAATYSINFYAAGSGCNSFAEIGDIIYHEYGHGISDRFYVFSGVSSMINGALNEGSSDTWAMSITGNPILGQGSYTSGSGVIRRYDLDPKVYPRDIVGEVHADGEIIAGAWWDVAVNTGSYELMGDLFTSSYYDTPDGPNGTEGDVYHQVLLAALTQDDDDADLSNGTPHFSEIVKAFARHGIYLLADIDIAHTELANQPKATDIVVNATASAGTLGFFFKGLMLNYKLRSATAWDTISMTDAGGGNFTATIPGLSATSVVDYYFTVLDSIATNGVFLPSAFNPGITANQTSLPFQFGVGFKTMTTINFESTLDTGWKLGVSTDDATTGKWICAVPIPSRTSAASGSILCQTGNDHTSGSGKCLVTGNAISATSNITSQCVKNGTTTAATPVFDISRYQYPVVEYYRWFGNDLGNFRRKDNWEVRISNKDGKFWYSVDNTYQSDYSWRKRIFGVKEYTSGFTTLQVNFIAKNIVSPSTGNSVVEAAVDDFVLYDKDTLLGVDEVNKQLAQIYPNPADNQVTVVLPAGSFKAGAVEFYDLTGKLVSRVEINPATSTYHIGTQELASGQYFMIVSMDKTIQAHKMTITHR